MSLTLSAKTYVNDVPRGSDIFRYNGPANTASYRDYVELYRTAAAGNGSATDKARARFKLTRSASDGTLRLSTDGVFDVNVSTPVGMVGTEIDALINEAAAFVSSAAFKALVKAQTINQ